MMNRWSITAALVCLASAVAHGATYHVATSGNDTNAGTQADPFRTIQRAANTVVAGDTVIIHAGTYTGFLVTASGTQAAPILFQGDGTVHIDGSATTNRDAVSASGGSWIIFDHLYVTGATRAGLSALDCSHITIRNSRFDQNGRWGVFSSFCDDLVVEDSEMSRSGSEHGVYASNSADRPIIRRNLIWGNGMCGVHMNGDVNFGGDGVISGAIVENNIIRDNGALGGSAINGDGVTNALIRNNVLDGNKASGVSLYRVDGGAASTGNKVINNTIRMASGARWAVNIQDGSTGNILRNNILLHPSTNRGAVDLCSTCISGLVSTHNAVVGRFLVGGTLVDLPTWRTRTGDTASFTATEAQLFVSGGLQLSPTSAAVDTGVATDAPATDVDGVPRPQGTGIDIGAYEYAVGGGPEPEPEPEGEDAGSGSGQDDGDNYVGRPPAVEEPTGCSAGGGAGLLLALALLVVRRRRLRG